LKLGLYDFFFTDPINKIETNRTNKDQLFFKPINEDFVTKQINKLNIKKATGYEFDKKGLMVG
jgi:hypothetical protein